MAREVILEAQRFFESYENLAEMRAPHTILVRPGMCSECRECHMNPFVAFVGATLLVVFSPVFWVLFRLAQGVVSIVELWRDCYHEIKNW